MMTSSDSAVAVLLRSVKLLTIGLVVQSLPSLIPYRLIPDQYEIATAIFSWVAQLIGICFLVAAARAALSNEVPTHG